MGMIRITNGISTGYVTPETFELIEAFQKEGARGHSILQFNLALDLPVASQEIDYIRVLAYAPIDGEALPSTWSKV